jgi:hypothetical protein
MKKRKKPLQVPSPEEESSAILCTFAYKESSGQVALPFLGSSLFGEENTDRVRYI